MASSAIREFYDFAVETAYHAGRLTQGYFRSDLLLEYKTDDTPVTAADRKSEQLIQGQIEKNYPHHSILGEEYGVSGAEEATHRWIIDPIDGTKSFVRGVPLYAVLIGLEIESRSVVSFTDAASFEKYGRADAWQRIMAVTSYRVGWSDAYGHALVATGRVELMLDPDKIRQV